MANLIVYHPMLMVGKQCHRPFKDGMRKILMENLVDSFNGGEVFIYKNDSSDNKC